MLSVGAVDTVVAVIVCGGAVAWFVGGANLFRSSSDPAVAAELALGEAHLSCHAHAETR
jgi:hypothetical protein